MSKTIGVIGSRQRNEPEDLVLVTRAFLSAYEEGDSVVSGGCPKGGDRFATVICCAFGVPLHEWLPDKSKLDKSLPYKAAYAKIAYARNTLIARDADVLIACVAPDRKGGTEDTIKKFLLKYYPATHPKGARALTHAIGDGKLVLV